MRLLHYYRKIVSFVVYRPLMRKCGKQLMIYKPILFSCRFVEVGDKFFLRNNARIEAVTELVKNQSPSLKIGKDVNIEQNVHLTFGNYIEIGDFTSIAANVSITDINHDHQNVYSNKTQNCLTTKSTKIGKNCTIYNNAVLLPGVCLGDFNIVAANSVVKEGHYPNYSMIAGIPAKIIKRYCFDRNGWFKTDAKGDFV